MEKEREGYTISTDPARLDISTIHGYLANKSYWAKNIPLSTVRRSIEHSLCFGLYHGTTQVGFARVVTDRAIFAYLADVFILETHRNKGLSKWLIETIHAHPDLQGLRRWILATRDAHGLYEQYGWKTLDEAACKRIMQRHFPDVYK